MKYLGLVIIQNQDILQSLINSKVVEPSISVFGDIPSLNLNSNFSVSFNSSFCKSNMRNELLNGSKYIVINNLNLDKKHIDLIKIILNFNASCFLLNCQYNRKILYSTIDQKYFCKEKNIIFQNKIDNF